MLATTKRFYQVLFYLFFIICYACQQQEIKEVTAELPTGFLLEMEDLPDYEKQIDHAKLIGNESNEFYHKGQIVYRNVCFNCHGDKDQEGSMPNSLKFWADSLKHGADPYSMYETLTRGYGICLLYTSPSPRDQRGSRMPSSA